MRMRKKIFKIILILVALCQTAVFAQTRKVTGKVVGPDNKSIAGASVTISGTTNGTVTDTDGNFTLPAPANASLLINSIGFTSQVIKVSGSVPLNIQLITGQSSSMEEVVVTGYASQRRKDIVGSVAVVDVKALKAAPSSSAMQALQGQAAGVNVTNNGSPGAPSLIFIRGITGFANAPLVLIDGVQGDINNVPADDVESIQVLKDAGATSIYGSRGANGVIVITTRKGKSGAPVISYDSYYNFQVPNKGSSLNTINAQEYASIMNSINPSSQLFIGGKLPDFLYNGRDPLTGSPLRGAALAGDPRVNPALYKLDRANRANNYLISQVNKGGQGGDVYDAIFSPALMMNHSVSASGGTEKANYLFSIGYLDHQGTLENTFLKRYNVRANTSYKIKNNVRVGENLNVFFNNNPQSPSNGNFGPIQQAYSQLPLLPLYDIAGNYAGAFTGPGDQVGDWGNAKADAVLTNNNRSRSYGMIGNVFLEIDLLKHFTARTSFGGALSNFYNQTYKYVEYWKANGGSDNRLEESSGFATTAQWTNTLAYKHQLGKHNISVLVGSESIENKSRQQYARGEKFLTDDYNYLVLGNAQVTSIPRSSATADALFSLFGKLDYSYNDKYLLGFTIRRDGFSAFGPDSKFGIFPAIALGWRVSQENFMKSVYWVNDMKIRGSYGIMGNTGGINPINSYTTYSQNPRFSYYDINGTGNSIVQGFLPRQNGNTLTKWEENKLLNIGFDATILKNKLDFSVDYYKKSTKGLLRPVQAPYTAGEASSPFKNIGNIENKGIDIVTTYRGSVSKDFQFSVGLNFTAYKNRIIKLETPGYFDEGIVRFQEGHPMTSFFGYKILGVFRDSNQVKGSPVQQDAQAGRYQYFDADGNDTINSLDRVHFGDANPSFTMGMNLGAKYKNFDFTAIIYTSQGNDIYNNQLEWLGSFERGISNKNKRVLNAWTPTNTNTMIKKNETGRNFSNTGVTNSDFLEDGSFIRLRSVQLGYNLPADPLKRFGISRLRFYITGVNLLTITNYSGLDPEVSGSGVGFRGQDAGAYVQEKGVAVGLNLGF